MLSLSPSLKLLISICPCLNKAFQRSFPPAEAVTPAPVNHAAQVIATIVEMGFSEASAARAVAITGPDIEAALEWHMANGLEAAEAHPTASTSVETAVTQQPDFTS
eukprot:COSAG02_NODE_33020_length_507_cov_0.448529_2_plen_105_part_01